MTAGRAIAFIGSLALLISSLIVGISFLGRNTSHKQSQCVKSFGKAHLLSTNKHIIFVIDASSTMNSVEQSHNIFTSIASKVIPSYNISSSDTKFSFMIYGCSTVPFVSKKGHTVEKVCTELNKADAQFQSSCVREYSLTRAVKYVKDYSTFREPDIDQMVILTNATNSRDIESAAKLLAVPSSRAAKLQSAAADFGMKYSIVSFSDADYGSWSDNGAIVLKSVDGTISDQLAETIASVAGGGEVPSTTIAHTTPTTATVPFTLLPSTNSTRTATPIRPTNSTPLSPTSSATSATSIKPTNSTSSATSRRPTSSTPMYTNATISVTPMVPTNATVSSITSTNSTPFITKSTTAAGTTEQTRGTSTRQTTIQNTTSRVPTTSSSTIWQGSTTHTVPETTTTVTPLPSTSTTTLLPPTSSPVPDPCDCDMAKSWNDIIVLLESSSALSYEKFLSMSTHIQSILYGLSIGQATSFNSRVGITVYANTVVEIANLTKYKSNDDFLNADYPYLGEDGTNIENAIGLAMDYFADPHQHRSRSRKVILLGANSYRESFKYNSPRPLADTFKANGGIIIVFAYGDIRGESHEVLQQLASPGYFIDAREEMLQEHPELVTGDLLEAAICHANCFCSDSYYPVPEDGNDWPRDGCYQKVSDLTFPFDFALWRCHQETHPGTMAYPIIQNQRRFLLSIIPSNLPLNATILLNLRKSSEGIWLWGNGEICTEPIDGNGDCAVISSTNQSITDQSIIAIHATDCHSYHYATCQTRPCTTRSDKCYY